MVEGDELLCAQTSFKMAVSGELSFAPSFATVATTVVTSKYVFLDIVISSAATTGCFVAIFAKKTN
jgi:hypothetical protein